MARKKTTLDRWGDDFENKPGRTTLKVLIIGSLVCMALGVLWFGWRAVTLPMRSAAGVAERVADPDNVIHNYEWFKRQHEAHAELEGRIANHQRNLDQFLTDAGDRKEWDRYDKQEASRLLAIVTGQQDQLLNLVKEYNARSRMATRSIFKTGDGKVVGDGGSLPEQLPLPAF